MPTRRTKTEVFDSIGRRVKPGDVIALATSGGYGNSAALRLVLLQHIYLDDSKGKPYYTCPIYYRDTETGLFYEHPTDETREGWVAGTVPVFVSDPNLYVPVEVKKPNAGWAYAGNNEIVGLQDCRLVGQPIDTKGQSMGKIATYEASNFILVEGVTPESLRKSR